MFRGTENFTCDHSKVSVFDLLLNAGTFCITYSVLYCCRNLIFYVISGSSFLSLASLLYVDYVLLVAIILHQLLFTTPVFPTLPRKIPPIFPVNGVIVKELPYGKADSSYTFTINTNGNGYTSGSNLYLNKAGDTAVAEISYKSGKYDKDGKPVDNIAAQKVTITAVDQSAVSEFAVKIDKAGKSFDKAKDTNKIAVEDTARTTAYFKIKDADEKEVSDSVYNKYTVESSDKSVLMLDSNTITVDSNKTRSVVLKGVKVGTAYLLFKDRDNKIVGSVAIDVVAKREVASITLDKNYLAISNTANTKRTVKATLKDQYGDDWKLKRRETCFY